MPCTNQQCIRKNASERVRFFCYISVLCPFGFITFSSLSLRQQSERLEYQHLQCGNYIAVITALHKSAIQGKEFGTFCQSTT